MFLASCGTNRVLGGGFWGVILTFVVDATEDVLGVTRLHHVALTGFFWGVLGCDIDVRCGCYIGPWERFAEDGMLKKKNKRKTTNYFLHSNMIPHKIT